MIAFTRTHLFAQALVLRACVRPTFALSEYEALAVVKVFADSFLAPGNGEIAKSINSTLFAEDVTGTADLSTNFDGRELSTEYLFGLFVNTAEDPIDPSPFGSPISYNVTALLVQHQYISSSIKLEFNYPVLNQTYPIQVDAFFLVNDDKEIQQYDVSFRRWAWATDTIISQLLPHMAEQVDIASSNSSNSTYVLQQYMGQKVCNTAMTYCNGSNVQYDSFDDCMGFVERLDVGHWYRMGENNLVCRNLHVPMVSLRPSVHCPHIGPTGGDMCIPRNYDQVVLDSHFPDGWLAPKFVTPENKDEVGGISAVSGEPLSPLIEIALSATSTNSWDPTLYPTAILCYLLLFYVLANILWFIYFRCSEVFPTLGLEHQKNVVMYTLNIIITTISLALELVATPAFEGTYALWEIQTLRTGGVLISSLYVFELVYRIKMRIPLIIHHFLTIFAISFTVCVFEYTQSTTYLISAVIWLFQATTEQPTFIGLLGYRLDWSPILVARILKFAAMQTFILKNYAYRSIDIAWTSMVFIIATGLLLTQIWGSYVTYTIGRKISNEEDQNNNLPHMQAHLNTSTSTGLAKNLAIYSGLRLRPLSNHPHQTLGSTESTGMIAPTSQRPVDVCIDRNVKEENEKEGGYLSSSVKKAGMGDDQHSYSHKYPPKTTSAVRLERSQHSAGTIGTGTNVSVSRTLSRSSSGHGIVMHTAPTTPIGDMDMDMEQSAVGVSGTANSRESEVTAVDHAPASEFGKAL